MIIYDYDEKCVFLHSNEKHLSNNENINIYTYVRAP